MARFDRVIPPGGEGKVTLQLNLKGFQGAIKKSATVFNNDPQNPRTLLVLQGNVKSLIDVRPANISFRGMADQLSEEVVELNSTGQRFRILKVENSLEDKVRYDLETVEDGKKYRLKVVNLAKRGTYSGFIKCFTDMAEKSEVVIRISGYIEGAITVKPMTVLIGKMAPQQPVRNGKVMVVSNLGKPFKITRLIYDDKMIGVLQEPLPKETGFSLEISPKLDNSSLGSRQQTVLTIQTDVAPEEQLQVQINIFNAKETATPQ